MSRPFRLRLLSLDLVFKRELVTVELAPYTYFYGEIGAGKSTIARIIDYCFGGKMDLSPAMQSEFVDATLNAVINEVPLSIGRRRDSATVQVMWGHDGGEHALALPARKADGVKLPGTEVEVLSDLLFHLAGVRPPRVRKSKLQAESTLERLSFRDLFWYCYLDQDAIDSAFFSLDDGLFKKRLKSRDVLRYVVGFHQERVAELESELTELQERRRELEGSATALSEALDAADVASEEEIVQRVADLEDERLAIEDEAAEIRRRQEDGEPVQHGLDTLRDEARRLSDEVEALDRAMVDVTDVADRDERYLNQLLMYGVKANRAAAARAVLSGVAFESCPRCAQDLPERGSADCAVCGQPEPTTGALTMSADILEADLQSRVNELKDALSRHRQQLRVMARRRAEFAEHRARLHGEIERTRRQYDSAFLSALLDVERRRAAVIQRVSDLQRLVALPRKVLDLRRQAAETRGEEAVVRERLDEARKAAERDQTNLRRLERLFLDCLVRSQLPGVQEDWEVKIRPPHFLPEVRDPETGDLAVTSFSNISSGGKKTLFKACFALAFHRLAEEVGAMLPTLLIIDSPMKNISERENRRQFEGFYNLVYELATGELSSTQFVLIDKEYLPPPEGTVSPLQRHMKPLESDTPVEDHEHPPLIPYYRG